MTITIHVGDALEVLRTLPAESVHCVVTSPPYWGLRCYGVDGQYGLEPTPEEHVAKMADVFREVRRVLRADGTAWINYGDSYFGGGYANHAINGEEWLQEHGGDRRRSRQQDRIRDNPGLKPKDLVGMPWRIAFALQQPYHVGPIKSREDRAWMAAMLDSDGCLGIRVQAAREGRGANETFIPYLSISQTDTGALERCVAITGLGKIRVKERPKIDRRGIASNRTYYTWRLDGQQASLVIRDAFPWLTIKRQQARVVYAMNESLRWGRPTRSLPVPMKIMEERRRLYVGIKALNQRALADLPVLADPPPSEEPGFYLRSDILWAKRNCMPESVTDRPTRSHEYVFLLAKSSRYFYDADAVREDGPTYIRKAGGYEDAGSGIGEGTGGGDGRRALGFKERTVETTGRNLRSVWHLATEPFPGSHFATMPTKLVEPCVKAGTSERGCCATCGKPWERVVEKDAPPPDQTRRIAHLAMAQHRDLRGGGKNSTTFGLAADEMPARKTTGFRPTCAHGGDPVPATILDPFFGAGTVGLVADRLGRNAIGIELNPEYARMAEKRIKSDSPLFAEVKRV